MRYRTSGGEYDRATVIGLAAAFGLVFLAIGMGGNLPLFFDLPSLLIVIGGTLGATLVNFPLDEVRRAFSVARHVLAPDRSSPEERLRKIIRLAEEARTSGNLVLESALFKEADPFLRKCTELVVDGISPDEIRRILDIEISLVASRHRRGAQLFQAMGNIAPAMGLIGTLIGLVQMLGSIDDPGQIGPAMAVALVTTFYGAVFANMLFIPIAGKLRARSEEEILIKEMTTEGMISIAQGINPRLLEESLLSFVPPERRISQFR
ncbi:MAG: MotA/TolQ/ExbB proton channel family protein [Deltaproteobacteria bacterium]|nr:MotA/TolQ/ExbB proton channel family protein [Deltaproteobacteria bacterium]